MCILLQGQILSDTYPGVRVGTNAGKVPRYALIYNSRAHLISKVQNLTFSIITVII